MTASAVKSTLILRRSYDVPVARLWRAWTDPAELGQWYVAGDDHIVHFCEAKVRVGGTYRIGFGPPGSDPIVETGHYNQVVLEKRLGFTEQVAVGGKKLHTNATVVDFIALSGGKSELVLTSIGKESWRTGEGWTPCLESLVRYVARNP